VLLKNVPLSSKPVFDFRRLFSLLSVATAVAGSGNVLRGIVGLLGTAGLSFSVFLFFCVFVFSTLGLVVLELQLCPFLVYLGPLSPQNFFYFQI
jgi:hypothetical protein